MNMILRFKSMNKIRFKTVSNTNPNLGRCTSKGQRSELTGSLLGQRDADIVFFLSVLLQRKHANKDVRIAW